MANPIFRFLNQNYPKSKFEHTQVLLFDYNKYTGSVYHFQALGHVNKADLTPAPAGSYSLELPPRTKGALVES